MNNVETYQGALFPQHTHTQAHTHTHMHTLEHTRSLYATFIHIKALPQT